jgi:hypothetical protein
VKVSFGSAAFTLDCLLGLIFEDRKRRRGIGTNDEGNKEGDEVKSDGKK